MLLDSREEGLLHVWGFCVVAHREMDCYTFRFFVLLHFLEDRLLQFEGLHVVQ